ncbi:MAG TPA: STAS domain-containing protein [Acidobacteriota bacterium]|nr:STAS domain-containing protein [Acidobacteriota bacterium]
MLRITAIESADVGVRLRVEGRLSGRSVEELRESCDLHALSKGTALTLDLADVSFADVQGIGLLKDLKSRDVALVNLVPFLALQLQDPPGG